MCHLTPELASEGGRLTECHITAYLDFFQYQDERLEAQSELQFANFPFDIVNLF